MVRVQLYDGSGSRILADNQGTTAQQQAYAQLTSSTGLNLSNGKYAVKVTYGTGGDKTQPQNYAIQIGSGTTFTADYRTLASLRPPFKTRFLAGGSTLATTRSRRPPPCLPAKQMARASISLAFSASFPPEYFRLRLLTASAHNFCRLSVAASPALLDSGKFSALGLTPSGGSVAQW